MKKLKINSLTLNKKMISNLTSIKAGRGIAGNESRARPTCPTMDPVTCPPKPTEECTVININ